MLSNKLVGVSGRDVVFHDLQSRSNIVLNDFISFIPIRGNVPEFATISIGSGAIRYVANNRNKLTQTNNRKWNLLEQIQDSHLILIMAKDARNMIVIDMESG